MKTSPYVLPLESKSHTEVCFKFNHIHSFRRPNTTVNKIQILFTTLYSLSYLETKLTLITVFRIRRTPFSRKGM